MPIFRRLAGSWVQMRLKFESSELRWCSGILECFATQEGLHRYDSFCTVYTPDAYHKLCFPPIIQGHAVRLNGDAKLYQCITACENIYHVFTCDGSRVFLTTCLMMWINCWMNQWMNKWMDGLYTSKRITRSIGTDRPDWWRMRVLFKMIRCIRMQDNKPTLGNKKSSVCWAQNGMLLGHTTGLLVGVSHSISVSLLVLPPPSCSGLFYREEVDLRAEGRGCTCWG